MPAYEFEFQSKLIASQIGLCKQLASNDVNNRKRGLRRLRTFLSGDHVEKSGFEDFSRIWIGLFNYVWMSDTPLVQEADADEISNLIHSIRDFDAVLLFVRGFFTTISSQWDRISHFRTDKFLMFIRRFLRQIFFLLKHSNWNSEKVEKLSSEFYSAIQILPVELTQHLNDIYTEELAKVSEGSVSTDTLIKLLKCFVDCILEQKPSKAVANYINANIFCPLVRQLKLLIKQKAAEGLDPEMFSLEAPEMEGNSSLDPRPGNVHVFLPYIDFDEKKIVEFLKQSISSGPICQRVKNILTQNIQMFESVTRLRQSMSQPTKILHEINDRERKRKKKSEKFSSLVKKACKRLDEKNDDFGTKKMKKLIRSSTWEVTKNVDTSAKPSVIEDWTVSDLRKKGPVSFSEETNSFTYQADSSRPAKTSSVPIVVPRSACEDRPGILIPDENYAIVDFGNLENDPKVAENVDSVPNKSEKKRKTKSISPRKTRSGRLVAARSEDTANIEPSWTSTRLEETDTIKSPIKNESVRRRSTRRKSVPVEISEKIDNVTKSSKRRKNDSTKAVKIAEEVEPSIEEKTNSEEVPVENEKIKKSRGRKSKVMKTQETSDELKSPEPGKSDHTETPDKNENSRPIKKSILHRTKYEPRKTRSGRIYNV